MSIRYKPVSLTNEKIDETEGYAFAGSSGVGYGAIPSILRQNTEQYEILVIAICVLVSDSTRGILFPTLWSYIQSLGGNQFWQGLAVAAFSLGRIFSSPILGYLSMKYGYSIVLIGSNSIILISCLGYVIGNSVWYIVMCQFVLGVGAGSLGVTRSFVAEKTGKTERTTYLAYLTAIQYGGFTVMPIVGAAVASYGHNNAFVMWNMLTINEYTLPSYMLGLLAVTCVVLLSTFTAVARSQDQTNDNSTLEMMQGSSSMPSSSPQSLSFSLSTDKDPDSSADLCESDHHDLTENSAQAAATQNWLIIGGCLLNMATKGTIGVFETLGLHMAISYYRWSTIHTGWIFASCGAVGVICLLFFHILVRYWRDVDLVMFGMATMVCSCALLAVQHYYGASSDLFSTNVNSSSSSSPASWPFFLALIMMYAIGYPIGHTALLGMFSKITSGPQGVLLGTFGSAGSLARIIFPIMAGVVSQYLQQDALVFVIMSAILIISIVVVLWNRNAINNLID